MNDFYKGELFASAIRQIQNSGAIINYTATALLRSTIDNGIDRASSTPINDPATKKSIEDNLKILVSALIIELQDRRLNEGVETKMFSNAKRSICPLWPFC